MEKFIETNKQGQVVKDRGNDVPPNLVTIIGTFEPIDADSGVTMKAAFDFVDQIVQGLDI